MSSNPFTPRWYYEMSKLDAERSSSPRKKLTVGARIVIAIFWAVSTLTLAFVLWAVASFFGGLDFWLCLVICGISLFWFGSLMAR